MKERSPLRAVNPVLVASILLLLLLGSVVIHSAVAGMDAGQALFKRHFLGMAVGAIGLLAFWIVDYRRLHGWVGPLLVADALLIISPRLPGLGGTAKGATLWLEVAGFRLFQPSEPAKLLFILALAGAISAYRGEISRGRDVARILGFIAVPMLLVVAVGDLGTGLVFAAIGAGMLLLGGLKGRWFVVLALAAVLVVGGLIGANEVLNRSLHRGNYDPAYIAAEDKTSVDDTSVLIKRYQMNRLLVFIDPSRDPDGAGYNLEQSKIAIGSGEVSGKGLGSGTQGNLNFLPERHTDFIFSVLGEELGFLGGVMLLGLYAVLLLTALGVATSSRDLFGSLIVAGVMAMWTFQILENIGMTIGLMPITGIPLPFMSYGASSMVTNLAATGMLLSVWARRY